MGIILDSLYTLDHHCKQQSLLYQCNMSLCFVDSELCSAVPLGAPHLQQIGPGKFPGKVLKASRQA